MRSCTIWALLPLTKFIDRDGQSIWRDMFPIAHMYAMKDNVIYAMPHDIQSSGIVYDIDAFLHAGLDPDPFALRNWDDLREAAKKLTLREADRVVRYGFSASMNGGQAIPTGWRLTADRSTVLISKTT